MITYAIRWKSTTYTSHIFYYEDYDKAFDMYNALIASGCPYVNMSKLETIHEHS